MQRRGPLLTGVRPGCVIPTSRATRVPHRTDNSGAQRTTTVTSTPPTSWSSSPDQQERIPRTCL